MPRAKLLPLPLSELPRARARRRTLLGAAALASAAAALLAGASEARAQCAPGRVVGPATAGRCCWPGQRWSPQYGRCDGPPQCPAGYAAAGDSCAPDSSQLQTTSSLNSTPSPPATPVTAAPVPAPAPTPAPPPQFYAPPAPTTWSPPPGQTYYVWPPGVLTPPGVPLVNAAPRALPPAVATPVALQPVAAPTPAAPPLATSAATTPATNTGWTASASTTGSAPSGWTPPPQSEPAPPPPAPVPPATPPPAVSSAPTWTPPPPAPRTERQERPYDGGPVPEGARVERRRSAALLATGASTFAVGWGVTLVTTLAVSARCTYGFSGGSATTRPVDAWSATGWIPFAGGIIAGASANCPRSSTAQYMYASPDGGVIALAIIGSVVQLAGGVLFGLGLREHAVLVYESRAAARALRRPGRVADWAVAPFALGDGVGVGAALRTF